MVRMWVKGNKTIRETLVPVFLHYFKRFVNYIIIFYAGQVKLCGGGEDGTEAI